jgi:hypothetical protein
MFLPSRRSLGLFLIAFPASALAQAAPPRPSRPDIAATASLSAKVARENMPVGFTISVKNKADVKNPGATAKNLRLLNLPAGYDLVSLCVFQANTCKSSKDVLWDTLEPGQSIAIQGTLQSANPHKPSILTAVLTWDSPPPGSSLVVTLGENQVPDWYETDFATGLMKILAVPLFLALATFLLNLLANWKEQRDAQRQHKREQDEAKAREAREELQAEAARIESVRLETWKQMLLISHQYAAKCYLPLSLAADRFSKNLLALGKPNGDSRVVFYYALLCGKAMNQTRHETGGLYFKDLRGEKLAAGCWIRQRESLMSANEADPFNRALKCAVDRLDDIDSYAAFSRKFEAVPLPATAYNDPEIQAAWVLFQKWLTNANAVQDVALCLSGFSAILDYESNRPYKYWYSLPDKLDADANLVQLFKELRQQYFKNQFSEQEIVDYIERREADPPTV